MAESIANRDESKKCLAIARTALSQNDFAKAERFALKAMNMHPSAEVEHLLLQIKRAADSASSRNDQAEENTHTHKQHANGHAPHQQRPDNNSQHRQHNMHRDHQQPAGMRNSNLRNRHSHSNAADTTDVRPDPGTPEQRQLVSQILGAKDLYEILGLAKTASDDDIRKSYRKLALKLHPDKNCAHKADEAFKAVGKAFACLSDPDKRAYYDRTGFESSTAAAAAQRQGSGGVQRGPAGVFYSQDFDPDEIFNMFFGGMHPGARVFRSQYGQTPPRRPQQTSESEGTRGASGDMNRLLFHLFQFLPVVLLVLISMFAASQKSPVSLVRDYHDYSESMTTSRLEVPFFVKNTVQFDRDYPHGTSARFKLERQVESDYYDKQQQRCQSEKMSRHRMWAYGKREEANRMPMVGCDEVERMNQKLGLRQNYAWG